MAWRYSVLALCRQWLRLRLSVEECYRLYLRVGLCLGVPRAGRARLALGFGWPCGRYVYDLIAQYMYDIPYS